MPSIEILIEKPTLIEAEEVSEGKYPFAIKSSCPPISHREPSLWQTRFSELGGVLVHIGERKFKGQREGWFYAYDLLELLDEECFRFKPEYSGKVLKLLGLLLSHSGAGRIDFTSDIQFGPKPLIEVEGMTLADFTVRHEATGIRFNHWVTITK